jgi:glycerophosphoryl diester phosphodiesterase
MTTKNWLIEKPFAHRGLHDAKDGRPENSLAAFEAARANDIGIELDVRISRDGVPVVFHDGTLERMCGRPERAEDLTAAELQSLSLHKSREKIPTLGQALDLIRGRVPLLIDLKHRLITAPRYVAKPVARAVGAYPGPTGVMSFCPRTVRWFREGAPRILRGQIVGTEIPREFAGPLTAALVRLTCRLFWGDPQFIAYEVDGLPAVLCERARRRDLPVVAWTVRDAETETLAKRHADNFICEYPRG